MKHQYAVLTNRWTGRTTRVRLEPNNWVSVKNYRAARVRIAASCGWNPIRSNVEFIIYDKYGPRELISQALED
jgi:hypothetical protein